MSINANSHAYARWPRLHGLLHELRRPETRTSGNEDTIEAALSNQMLVTNENDEEYRRTAETLNRCPIHSEVG